MNAEKPEREGVLGRMRRTFTLPNQMKEKKHCQLCVLGVWKNIRVG